MIKIKKRRAIYGVDLKGKFSVFGTFNAFTVSFSRKMYQEIL